MQLLQPEVKEIQRRYKGDAMKARLAQQELFKERGINPLAGCFPLLLQMPLLFIMYSVIQNGLTNVDPTGDARRLRRPGRPARRARNVNADRRARRQPRPVHRHGHPDRSGEHRRQQAVDDLRSVAGFVLGISILAIVSAAAPAGPVADDAAAAGTGDDDPNTKIQRQTMLFLPLISVVYGGFLPAGLFIYWITATIFSIVQQYLIVGWGGMFPLFGWTPAFAAGHTPRFPVSMPPPPEPEQACGHPDRRGQEDDGRQDDPPPRAGPSGPTRETTLT